eukprot:505016-Prorocentrum_minimum.AAC.2
MLGRLLRNPSGLSKQPLRVRADGFGRERVPHPARPYWRGPGRGGGRQQRASPGGRAPSAPPPPP